MTTLNLTSNGAILVRQSEPLIFDEFKLQETLEPKQVLVKMMASGVCGKQLDEISGKAGPDKYLPHLLGHEGVGQVVEIGKGCTSVNVGDFVCLHWRPNYSENITGPKHIWKNKILNAGPVTTFSELTICAENKLTVVAKTIDIDFLSILGCALLTGYGIIKNNIGSIKDSSILIIGSGGIGISVLLFSILNGAKEIVCVDKNKAKLRLASNFGVEVEHVEKIKSVVNRKFNYVIDTTSDKFNLNYAIHALKNFGKLILVGVPFQNQSINLPLNFLFDDKIIIGSHGGSVTPKDDIPLIINLYKENKNIFHKYPTTNFEFKKVNDAISELRNGVVGRAILHFRS